MEVCLGPGPIIEEGEEEGVTGTPGQSSLPEEVSYTPQEPLIITTGQISAQAPPAPLTSDLDPVCVNSLNYNVYIFNITLYIQINYEILSIEYECPVQWYGCIVT